MNKETRLIHGWGIADVDYTTHKTEVIAGKQVIVWRCPYYVRWSGIITRCFDTRFQEKRATYKDCTVCEEWKYLSNFIKWVDSQPNKNWQNCDLDKDLLIEGNKHYSPDNCVFIDPKINNFLTDGFKRRGKLSLGVSLEKKSSKKPFISTCNNPFRERRHSGYVSAFPTELEAHKAWQAKKHEYACQLADLQEDERVAKALRERYAPDKDWTLD